MSERPPCCFCFAFTAHAMAAPGCLWTSTVSAVAVVNCRWRCDPPSARFYILFVAVEARQRAGKQITRCSVATLLPLLCLDGASLQRPSAHVGAARSSSCTTDWCMWNKLLARLTAAGAEPLSAGLCKHVNQTTRPLSVSLDDHTTRSHIAGKRSDRRYVSHYHAYHPDVTYVSLVCNGQRAMMIANTRDAELVIADIHTG
ncbi:hypothetical protein EDD15DRAFT_48610 [Pisolithus albus]|nr:hypothetical protein EDD15DRAFT_48610 [Pisolithus albus]